MNLNDKLKRFSKSGKAWVLSAVMTVAGALGVQAQNHSEYDSPVRRNPSASYHQSQEEENIVRMGVLLPRTGESPEAYEVRRVRLENRTRLLNKKAATAAYQQWMKLKREKANKKLIDAAAKSYADHFALTEEGGWEGYYSFYTPLGQGKLKYGSAYKGPGPTTSKQKTGVAKGNRTVNPVPQKQRGYVDDF